MPIYLLVLLNIILLVAGQTLWKLGLERIGGLHVHNVMQVLSSPFILMGIALYGVATVAWLAVLARLPLSLAYPMQSLAYVLGLFSALYIFHEPIPLNRWIGAVVIIVGVVILSVK